MQQLRYYEDLDTGLVISRLVDRATRTDAFAVPVLDYAAIGMGGDGYEPGDFRGPTRFTMDRMTADDWGRAGYWSSVRGIKHVPVAIKNMHRAYWGLPELREAAARKRYVVDVPGEAPYVVVGETRPHVAAFVLERMGRKSLPRGTRLSRDWFPADHADLPVHEAPTWEPAEA